MFPARRWRSVATTALVLAVVFAVGAGAGFLLEHEPARDERRIAIDRDPPPAGPDAVLGGEVTEVGGGRISIRTPEGIIEFELPAGAPTEELRRAAEPRFTRGDAVNLGGEQGDFGIVLTGVVALEPENAGVWP